MESREHAGNCHVTRMFSLFVFLLNSILYICNRGHISVGLSPFGPRSVHGPINHQYDEQ